jgi:2-oxoglutarate ferredoxin oxidoreductase subunit alpha
MVRTRQAKVDAVARSLPPLQVDDPDDDARVLVLGWGSTYGPIGAACRQVRAAGGSVAQVHLRHLNPLPADLARILGRYERVVIPEMNLGQLAQLIRAKYLIDAMSVTQVRGLPFKADELAEMLQGVIDNV